jgi:DNA-binding LytR/AlgR family response regulator
MKKQFLVLKEGTNLCKIEIDSIYLISVKNDCCMIFSTERMWTVSYRLCDLLKLLPADTFFQVHRSNVVNIHYVYMIGKREIIVQESIIPTSPAFHNHRMMDKFLANSHTCGLIKGR